MTLEPHQQANRKKQLNPSHELYWKSRGWKRRPKDWQRRVAQGDVHPPEHSESVAPHANSASGFLNSLLSIGKTSNDKNPDHLAYWQARGWDEMPARTEKNNPNNDAYWVLKGYEERPPNWRNKV